MAVNDVGTVVGSFYVKPNYPDRCSHICNGGFLVSQNYRGNGIGKFLGICLPNIKAPLEAYAEYMA